MISCSKLPPRQRLTLKSFHTADFHRFPKRLDNRAHLLSALRQQCIPVSVIRIKRHCKPAGAEVLAAARRRTGRIVRQGVNRESSACSSGVKASTARRISCAVNRLSGKPFPKVHTQYSRTRKSTSAVEKIGRTACSTVRTGASAAKRMPTTITSSRPSSSAFRVPDFSPTRAFQGQSSA